MLRLFKNKRGFTLVELLVTVVILGIIIGMAFPILGNVSNYNLKKYITSYASSIESKAKLYVSSFSDDLFGRRKSGCAIISYEMLKKKKLATDIDLNDLSCDTNKTYVVVIKKDDNFSYKTYLGCGKADDSNVVSTIDTFYPFGDTESSFDIDNSICGDSSILSSISLSVSPRKTTGWVKSKSINVSANSYTGIYREIDIKYAWSTSDIAPTDLSLYTNLPFKVKGTIAQNSLIENNKVVTSSASPIATPEGTGTYYLHIMVNKLSDLYLTPWKQESGSKFVTYGPYNIDNTPPVIKRIVFYSWKNLSSEPSYDIDTTYGQSVEIDDSDSDDEGDVILDDDEEGVTGDDSGDDSGDVGGDDVIDDSGSSEEDSDSISCIMTSSGYCRNLSNIGAKLYDGIPTSSKSLADNTYPIFVSADATDINAGTVRMYYKIAHPSTDASLLEGEVGNAFSLNYQGSSTIYWKACDILDNCTSWTKPISIKTGFKSNHIKFVFKGNKATLSLSKARKAKWIVTEAPVVIETSDNKNSKVTCKWVKNKTTKKYSLKCTSYSTPKKGAKSNSGCKQAFQVNGISADAIYYGGICYKRAGHSPLRKKCDWNCGSKSNPLYNNYSSSDKSKYHHCPPKNNRNATPTSYCNVNSKNCLTAGVSGSKSSGGCTCNCYAPTSISPVYYTRTAVVSIKVKP